MTAVAVAGVSAIVAALLPASSGPPLPPVTSEVSKPAPTSTDVPGADRTLPRSKPVGLEIPAAGIAARELVALDRRADGRLETPRNWGAVGWYAAGPWPGQLGTAVMTAHVDSRAGPAIFFRIGELRPGDAVTVPRADGTVAVFTVYAVERYPKNRFPTRTVYAASDRAELRLITCGGDYDDAAGSYRDNVVAYAALAGVRRPDGALTTGREPPPGRPSNQAARARGARRGAPPA